MLGKCANPTCATPFRKLGNGKLYAFESLANARCAGSRRSISRTPVFYWLCECCSLSFTLRIDCDGRLTMQRIPNGVRVTIFDGHPMDQAS
jgi:hypothetical protein